MHDMQPGQIVIAQAFHDSPEDLPLGERASQMTYTKRKSRDTDACDMTIIAVLHVVRSLNTSTLQLRATFKTWTRFPFVGCMPWPSRCANSNVARVDSPAVRRVMFPMPSVMHSTTSLLGSRGALV